MPSCKNCKIRDEEVLFLRSLTMKLMDNLHKEQPSFTHVESDQGHDKNSKAMSQFFADVLGSEEESNDDGQLDIERTQ